MLDLTLTSNRIESMIIKLDKIKLESGEELVIKCIEPLEEIYRDKLGRFLVNPH